jgi:hypothetical protein
MGPSAWKRSCPAVSQIARLTVAALMFNRLLKKDAAQRQNQKLKTEERGKYKGQTLHCTLLLVTEHVVDITAPLVRALKYRGEVAAKRLVAVNRGLP